MTVAELRELLAQHSNDATVLVPGYETDWDALTTVRPITVCAKPDIILPGPFNPIREPIGRPEYEGAFAECARDEPVAFEVVAMHGNHHVPGIRNKA